MSIAEGIETGSGGGGGSARKRTLEDRLILTSVVDFEADYQSLLETIISQWQKVDSMPEGNIADIDNEEITLNVKNQHKTSCLMSSKTNSNYCEKELFSWYSKIKLRYSCSSATTMFVQIYPKKLFQNNSYKILCIFFQPIKSSTINIHLPNGSHHKEPIYIFPESCHNVIYDETNDIILDGTFSRQSLELSNQLCRIKTCILKFSAK